MPESRHHDETNSEYRCTNFNAGPSALPLEVLHRVRRELLNFNGTGCSIMETSHRSSQFKHVMDEAKSNYRNLFNLPDSHEVIFAQGGGTAQTAAILFNNVRRQNGWAGYVVNGAWSRKAYDEAGKLNFHRGVLCEPTVGRVACPTEWGSSAACDDFAEDCFQLPSSAPSIIHHCNNETISGLEYHFDAKEKARGHLPASWVGTDTVWTMDASSNFCSKPLKVSNYDVIYAGAQKNVGTSGITVCLLNKHRFMSGPKTPECPTIMDYSVLLKNDSLHNTIPVMPMYITGLVAKHLVQSGGLTAAEERATAKSSRLYDYIDGSDGFYRCTAQPGSRSKMNHVWRICGDDAKPMEDLEAKFVADAEARGLIGLKGHRSVGGLRASIYNAVTDADVMKLIDFMTEFKEKCSSN